MYATGAFKNPFADFDFTKIAGDFKFPMVNVESVVETGRKNFAAMTSASTAAVETMKTIATRQGDMFRAAMEDFSKHGSDVLAAATVEEKVAKQIDFAKKGYDMAVANTKELADLYTKSQTEAFETLNTRIAELTEEVKAAIAAKKKDRTALRARRPRGAA
jgi:phasin family protein